MWILRYVLSGCFGGLALHCFHRYLKIKMLPLVLALYGYLAPVASSPYNSPLFYLYA
jgi:hypothetical protein